MGSFSLSGVFTALPDPMDYQPERLTVVGQFLNGKPVRMGWENGTLIFPMMPSAGWNELRARYEANKNAQVSGNLPAISGYGFRAVSAWWGEPIYTGLDGPLVHGVTLPVFKIGNY